MQKENFDLKKEKKDKYESLEKENAEMLVKGQKDFNKNNEEAENKLFEANKENQENKEDENVLLTVQPEKKKLTKRK